MTNHSGSTEELDYIYRLARATTRADVLNELAQFASLQLGIDYLQLWMADEDDPRGSLLLVYEYGNLHGTIAKDLFRLLPQQGIAGRAWARRESVVCDTLDPGALELVAAREFVEAERLRTLAALPLQGVRQGVVLAASRDNALDSIETRQGSLGRFASAALDRWAELLESGALAASQFVAHALALSESEQPIMAEALARLAKVVHSDWSIYLRCDSSTQQVTSVCSHPPGAEGFSGPASHVALRLFERADALRAYRIGRPTEFASNVAAAGHDDLYNFLAG